MGGRTTGRQSTVAESKIELLASWLLGYFRPADRPQVMWSMMLSPNSEHLISVAPSIKRAKS
jgi:hypothetical protein